MADTKLTALSEIGAVAAEDLFYVVDDPSGTPVSNKVTGTKLKLFTSPWTTIVATTNLPVATSAVITSIPQTYTQLLLRIRGLSNASAGAHSIQVDSDAAGGSFDTTAGNYTGIAALSNAAHAASNQASLSFLDGSSFAAANTADYEMIISGYTETMPGVMATMRVPFTNTYRYAMGMYAGAEIPVQAIRILGPGNFDAGTYALFGK